MKKNHCLLCLLVISSVAYADDHKGFVYDEHGRRDPFSPLASPSGVLILYDSDVTATDMNLEGLVIDAKGNNLAILNGKVIKINDQIGPYTVKAIANDHVDLVKGQERLTVKLKKGVL